MRVESECACMYNSVVLVKTKVGVLEAKQIIQLTKTICIIVLF